MRGMIRKWFTLKRLFLVALIFAATWAGVVVALTAAIISTGAQDNAQPSDVIVVLGSGLRRSGRPGDALYRRSIWAADLYADGIAQNIICTGGVGNNQTRSEADACAEVLRGRGVPAEAIHLEEASRSTEENAIFTQELLQAHGWQTVTLVTDSFHMLRASWIFDTYNIPHYRSPTPREWMPTHFFVRHSTRELLALHWQAFKQVFNIPVTNLKWG